HVSGHPGVGVRLRQDHRGPLRPRRTLAHDRLPASLRANGRGHPQHLAGVALARPPGAARGLGGRDGRADSPDQPGRFCHPGVVTAPEEDLPIPWMYMTAVQMAVTTKTAPTSQRWGLQNSANSVPTMTPKAICDHLRTPNCQPAHVTFVW